MIGNIALFLVLHNLAEGLSSVKLEDGSAASPTLTQEDEYCQSLCGSSGLTDCGKYGSYCKPFGNPEDGVGVCQGFYHLPNSSDVCFYNTNPEECPEGREVFCRGVTTTTAEPGPTTTAEPGPTTTTEPGPTTTAEPGPTTTAEPGPTTTAEPGPTTTAEPGPTTTAEPGPTTTAEPGPTTTAEPGPTTTAEPGPTTTAAPVHPGYPTGLYEGSTTLGETTVTARALFAESETLVQEMNVTVASTNIQLTNLPYEIDGANIQLTDLSSIPEAYRGLIAGATLTYDQDAETITFSLDSLGLSIVLGRPTTRRRLIRFA
ncbi:hypothetical protein FOL47_007798 [Perkinsus chesapeaki]|uniref:Uncharacterized protein n=1 Tax=Perkinsus chesapeaki TaxID=330153 RepID=A0A7J6LHW2_PERCH|nr:hypothetical protein FOL47_007798 [Perkinsus chesapeaki]